ncbi:MAG: hypothetical protein MH472_02575 [Bacteroidia bacterium]|nr:hypothetical protein [Bacteroidia bacterium]
MIIKTLIDSNKNVLSQLEQAIKQLSENEFSESLPILSEVSIGKHVRHIIELYQEFLLGAVIKIINYDQRKRNILFEQKKEIAIAGIHSIMALLSQLESDTNVTVRAQFENDILLDLPSTISRELAYNLEHAIHHMAIIQICIKHHFPSIKLHKDFGLAYSTIQYNSTHVHANIPTS